MNEYIKSAELCRRCKYSAKGAICEPISRCDGCKQDDGGACRCNSIKAGEPCPYFAHPFGVWISVKDDLPKSEKPVLVYVGYEDGKIGFITTSSYFCYDPNPHWQWDGLSAIHGQKTLFWMPLPEPPEEEII